MREPSGREKSSLRHVREIAVTSKECPASFYLFAFFFLPGGWWASGGPIGSVSPPSDAPNTLPRIKREKLRLEIGQGHWLGLFPLAANSCGYRSCWDKIRPVGLLTTSQRCLFNFLWDLVGWVSFFLSVLFLCFVVSSSEGWKGKESGGSGFIGFWSEKREAQHSGRAIVSMECGTSSSYISGIMLISTGRREREKLMTGATLTFLRIFPVLMGLVPVEKSSSLTSRPSLSSCLFRGQWPKWIVSLVLWLLNFFSRGHFCHFLTNEDASQMTA